MAGVLGLGVLVAACGATALPGGSAARPASSGAGASAPSASGSGDARPKPTPWPGNTVHGIEALGVSDGEIRKGIADLSRGIAEEDLALMREAADGLAGVEVLVPNADRIAAFPPMRPLADGLRAVLPRIADASRRLRDAIDARDAEAIGTSSIELTRALGDYTRLQPELATWVEQSIEQQRLLAQ